MKTMAMQSGITQQKEAADTAGPRLQFGGQVYMKVKATFSIEKTFFNAFLFVFVRCSEIDKLISLWLALTFECWDIVNRIYLDYDR